MVGTPLNPPSPVKLPYPIKLVPRERKDYFVPHQSFNVLQMLQNPMMLIMVFGGLMMLAMPYIMVKQNIVFDFSPSRIDKLFLLQKNMDPEVLQEARQSHTKLGALQNGDLRSVCTLSPVVQYTTPNS
jgi:ER membrane protein complex subunit 7